MLRSKVAEINASCMLYWALDFQINIYFRVTYLNINNNLGLPFWMKTKFILAYVYQEYPKNISILIFIA